ncbi:hypothetical protein BTJ39_04680 [Izhakiella australiensis]|uniref:Uncharacterized protein n=1 Tax=Izhakiella australiensis TaxID=1926881 RepID=A0A1S8YQC5_9GAMM|nr:type V toxin-antitoxin system endoribonuclease antitoxin GhoS [Izhakiella australiensis]OON41264.1 hypothetical protein BTJ39_04680 [Izhakiella australiensis]
MNDRNPKAYVVTLEYHEEGLADLMELNSAMINGGFKTALHDSDGHPHELGTNSFGIISANDEDTLCKQAEGLAEMALDKKPAVKIATFEAFLSQHADNRR